MSAVAVIVVILAVVGAILLVRDFGPMAHSAPPQAPVVYVQNPTQPPPPPVIITNDNNGNPGNNGSGTDNGQNGGTTNGGVNAGPLDIHRNAQPVGVDASGQTITLGQGDAAVIQAYQIGDRQMCQVAGVLGPASVPVKDGRAYIFHNVYATKADLQHPMNQAAQEQQDDKSAGCPQPNQFYWN